jgi:hypothetical protein
MPLATFDVVIPLFKVRWNTRAVLEGLTFHYQPRSIHVITPSNEARSLQAQVAAWQVAPLHIHPEEPFFEPLGFSKESICAELNLGESLYNPGWFYQQLLKLGAFEGIPDLSDWYLVWDSDLLPVATWPIFQEDAGPVQHPFALLQHNAYGNPQIVGTWAKWIRAVLGVEPLTDAVGTFIPHHMWFNQTHLKSLGQQINAFYESEAHWLRLMMRSANDFGTFSEYWAYTSWVAAKAPADLVFYPYEQYGETTERFFDDGTGLFSQALRDHFGDQTTLAEPYAPDYERVLAFIRQAYGTDRLPSSIAFESSPRHLKKDAKNMHIEESRSRWNPRLADSAAL